VQGQAADAAGALLAIGFGVAEVGDYPRDDGMPVGRTTVLFGDGGEDAARTVARHISGGAALVYDVDVDDSAVVLVTGSDFTTIHDQPAPEGSPDDLRITTSTTGVPTSSDDGSTTTSTTSTTLPGYATGEPPPGVDCG
jgi:hypothetical protein